MREEADDILYSIGLSDEQKEVQHSIKQVRGSLFKEKIPYLRMKKFNMCRQEEGEPVDSFTTSPGSPASRTLQLYTSYTLKRSDIGLLWTYEIQIYQRDCKLIQN